MHDIQKRLKELGLMIPDVPPAPAGSYRPYIEHNGLLAVSGQTCKVNGNVVYQGRILDQVSIEEGIEAARLCGLNLISQLNQALAGSWERLEQCLKLTVYINSSQDFKELPKIADGASNLFYDVFGVKGQHTRAAIGAATLPSSSSVEIDGLFAVKTL